MSTRSSGEPVWQRFAAVAERRPDHPALVDAPGTSVDLTHEQLLVEATAVARGLAAVGVGHSTNIGIFEPNRSRWLAAWLGAARLGANVVGLNTRFRTAELDHLLGVAGIEVLVAPETFLGVDPPALFASLERCPHLVVDGEATPFVDRELAATSWAELTGGADSKGGAGDTPEPSGGLDDLTIGFTTSGTTGFPKLACHTQRSLLHHSDRVIEAYGLDESSVAFVALPLCGTFGFNTAIPTLLAGGTVVLDDTWDAGRAARRVASHDVTFMNGSDDMILAMVDHPDFERATTLRVGAYADFTNQGPTCVAAVEERTGGRFRIAGTYGSSEGFALMCRWDGDSIDDRARNGGPLVDSDYRVQVCDPNASGDDFGTPLPHGEPGELWFQGENYIHGYLNNPEADARAFTTDGWFRSGDLGYTIDDHTFVFQARLGDSLRLRGFLCDPSEIEHHLETHDLVDLAQVVGATVPGEGDVAVAFVRLVDDALDQTSAALDQTQAALEAHCRSGLANYKRPAHFEFVTEFPVTDGPNGVKIRKVELRDRAQALLG